MKLTKILISNFRSIKKVELEISDPCLMFVGINESGKSNILKAISLFDETCVFNASDIREPSPNENDNLDSFVRFEFVLDQEEKQSIINNLKSKIYTKDLDTPIISINNNLMSIKQFIDFTNLYYYKIKIKENTREYGYSEFNDPCTILTPWKKPSSTIASDIQITTLDSQSAYLNNYSLLNVEDFPTILAPELFDDTIIADLQVFIFKEVARIIENKRPKTIFWKHDETNLQQSNIDIVSFANNPNSCLALKSMFELSNIKDITKEIEISRNRGKYGTRNLLDRISENTTKYFRKVWKEYDNISFFLFLNGNSVEISIKDVYNHYEFVQRSDGFKRFINFLLFISAKVSSDNINNSILIFDEPDIGLHPSGVKYLRNELINISKGNYIFLSTHSVFMIDKENIGRHLIVKKTDEVTELLKVDSSNICDEEVIFNALGHSIFENLKSYNIIFEGWTDKKMFQIALTSNSIENKKVIDSFKKIGQCHAHGVKDIKHVAAILELAERNYFVISDSDKAAKEYQKHFNEERLSGTWKRYDELFNEVKIMTSEDFLKDAVFNDVLKEIKEKYEIANDFKYELIYPNGKIMAIDIWLSTKVSNKDSRNNILKDLKVKVFDNLCSSDIEEHYYKFLGNLKNHLVLSS